LRQGGLLKGVQGGDCEKVLSRSHRDEGRDPKKRKIPETKRKMRLNNKKE